MAYKRFIPVVDEKNINVLNLILAGSCVLCGFVLCLTIFNSGKNKIIRLTTQKQIEDVVPDLKLVKKSLKYYERVLGRRKLFVAQPGLKRKIAKKERGLVDMLTGSDLVLMGIVSGSGGPQAIISNSKTGQSFNCFGGESIDEIKVKEVLTDKVLLEVNGEVVELIL